jgi:hypothetical protein
VVHVIIQVSSEVIMTNKFRVQIERVENGYVITNTYDGTSFNDYSTTTLIKQDVNEAIDVILKELSKITVAFSNMDEKGSL